MLQPVAQAGRSRPAHAVRSRLAPEGVPLLGVCLCQQQARPTSCSMLWVFASTAAVGGHALAVEREGACGRAVRAARCAAPVARRKAGAARARGKACCSGREVAAGRQLRAHCCRLRGRLWRAAVSRSVGGGPHAPTPASSCAADCAQRARLRLLRQPPAVLRAGRPAASAGRARSLQQAVQVCQEHRRRKVRVPGKGRVGRGAHPRRLADWGCAGLHKGGAGDCQQQRLKNVQGLRSCSAQSKEQERHSAAGPCRVPPARHSLDQMVWLCRDLCWSAARWPPQHISWLAAPKAVNPRSMCPDTWPAAKAAHKSPVAALGFGGLSPRYQQPPSPVAFRLLYSTRTSRPHKVHTWPQTSSHLFERSKP